MVSKKVGCWTRHQFFSHWSIWAVEIRGFWLNCAAGPPGACSISTKLTTEIRNRTGSA